MPSNAEKFKRVFTDAELVIKNKIELLLTAENATKEEIDPVILYCHEVAQPFRNSNLYLIDFEFDEAGIRRELLVFSSSPITNASVLKNKVTALAELIQEAGLKEAIEKAENRIDSVINEEIISEITKTRSIIRSSFKRIFKPRRPLQEELKQDEHYKKYKILRRKHKPAREQYCEALKDKHLQGFSGDWELIHGYGSLFAADEHKADFVNDFQTYCLHFEKEVKKLEGKPA